MCTWFINLICIINGDCKHDSLRMFKKGWLKEVNDHDQKLWLKWNTIYKKLQHIKWSYVGTDEKEVIDDMISYVKKLMDELENK